MPEGEGGEARGRLSCSRVISLWWPKDPMVLSHSRSQSRKITAAAHALAEYTRIKHHAGRCVRSAQGECITTDNRETDIKDDTCVS